MNALEENFELSVFLGRRGILARPDIRPIHNLSELSEVYQLTHQSYVENQYAKPHASKMLIHYPYFDHLAETTVLVAMLHDEIVGTVSYTLDGPSGLTVDEDFLERCNEERAAGKKIAAVWRLVVTEKHRHQREIVTGLIREAIVQLSKHAIESCFFSVNPKHAMVYKKMLNMKEVAQKEITKGLSNAPAVLLMAERHRIPSRIIPPDDSFSHPITVPILLNLHAF